uniref:Colipase like 1 n=1 Tax=Spermophilus dauricus TaxID=99837 RepID=A0A8C9QUI3_SPEDA
GVHHGWLNLLFFFFFLILEIEPRETSCLCRSQQNGNICFQNQGCKSRCCRKADDNCESHCTMLGSEGSKCQTQIFFGLYKECPCHSNLTCIFPKNQKTFKLIYGSCEKYVNQKTLEKTWF